MHPAEIELGLDRVRGVAQSLSLNLGQMKMVVIAGTNGKGSTVAALQAIALKHGLSVGAYTSPHLLDFSERIQLDGRPLSDDVLCRAFAEIEKARGTTRLTFFEFTTLAALVCFNQYQPHICLLEVGLGGRLDAVNIIDADITVITNIQLDHEAWLGLDRQTIAREKAGIFRAGVPAICAEKQPPSNLAQLARDKGAVWMRQGEDFCLQQDGAGWCWRGDDVDGRAVLVCGQGVLKLEPDAVAAAIQASLLFLPLPQLQLVALAVESLCLRGRCQFLSTEHGTIVLDVAHNPAAASRLATVLGQKKSKGKTHAIFAMLSGKRALEFTAALKPHIDGQWWLPRLRTPRAQAARQLATSASLHHTVVMENTEAALEQALAAMGEDDRLLVTGSFYTVAEVVEALEKRGINFE
jgi:dihydrofolate synthase/folylpolyglutamate synthase